MISAPVLRFQEDKKAQMSMHIVREMLQPVYDTPKPIQQCTNWLNKSTFKLLFTYTQNRTQTSVKFVVHHQMWNLGK